MNVRVRSATRSDLDAIARIAQERPFTARWGCAALEEEVAREDSIFICAEATTGGVLGYALARVTLEEGRVLDVAVNRDSLGIGKALWQALMERAVGRGCRVLTLEVSTLNTRARAFYAAAGGRVVGIRKKFYDDGSDACLMDFPLK